MKNLIKDLILCAKQDIKFSYNIENSEYDTMDQEWYEHIADNYNVVVSLVRRSTIISASTSTNQGFCAMDKDKARKRKRLLNLEEEQNLGDLYINSC